MCVQFYGAKLRVPAAAMLSAEKNPDLHRLCAGDAVAAGKASFCPLHIEIRFILYLFPCLVN